MADFRGDLPSLVEEQPPALHRILVVLCAAIAGTLGLWEFLYGVWATAWNLGHRSFVAAGATSAVMLATPATAIAIWRRARIRGLSRWAALARSTFFGTIVALVVAMFLVVAAVGMA